MSFFRYPGGKNKIINPILDKIENITSKLEKFQYREPFFGAGSVGVNVLKKLNTKIDNVWINDKDIGIACLWYSAIFNKELLKKKIKEYTPHVDDFFNFKNDLIQITEYPKTIEEVLEIGFKKLVIHQISYSGLGTKSGGPLGGKSQISKYKIDCRWSSDYINKKIDKIYNQSFSKNKINVSCNDFKSLIVEKNINENVFIYLDPPYYEKGGELYQHSFGHEQHVALADCLKYTNHKWLLSYDCCDQIKKLYSWANIDIIEVPYTINTSRIKKEFLIYG